MRAAAQGSSAVARKMLAEQRVAERLVSTAIMTSFGYLALRLLIGFTQVPSARSRRCRKDNVETTTRYSFLSAVSLERGVDLRAL